MQWGLKLTLLASQTNLINAVRVKTPHCWLARQKTFMLYTWRNHCITFPARIKALFCANRFMPLPRLLVQSEMQNAYKKADSINLWRTYPIPSIQRIYQFQYKTQIYRGSWKIIFKKTVIKPCSKRIRINFWSCDIIMWYNFICTDI